MTNTVVKTEFNLRTGTRAWWESGSKEDSPHINALVQGSSELINTVMYHTATRFGLEHNADKVRKMGALVNDSYLKMLKFTVVFDTAEKTGVGIQLSSSTAEALVPIIGEDTLRSLMMGVKALHAKMEETALSAEEGSTIDMEPIVDAIIDEYLADIKLTDEEMKQVEKESRHEKN